MSDKNPFPYLACLENETFRWILIIGLGIVIFFSNISGWDLWNPDEPRYAQVAKEMVETGEFIVPHLNGDIYPDKPPIFFWIIAAFSILLGGFSEVSVRLPSALSAILIIALTYKFGKKLFNSQAGLFSALILATNVEFFWLGRRANIDMTLTLFIFLSFYFYYLGYIGGKREKVYYMLFYFFMGIATLTKGPVGFIIPLLSIFSFLILNRDIKAFAKSYPVAGFAVFFLVILVWLIPACIKGGEAYTHEILFKQTVSRYTTGWSHQRPFYYYFINFPADFAPWIILIPWAIYYFYFVNPEVRKNSEFKFCFAWFVATFIFFSLSSGKRNLYLLPAYPAITLLLGYFIDRSIATGQNIFFKQPFYLLGILFIILGMGGGILSFLLDYQVLDIPVSLTPCSLLIFGILGFLGGVFMMVVVGKNLNLLSFYTGIGLLTLTIVFTVFSVLPKINRVKSPKFLGEKIVSLVKREDKLIKYRYEGAGVNYYTGINRIKDVKTPEKLIEILEKEKNIYCLIRKRHYDFIQKKHKISSNLKIVDEYRIGHRKILIVTNKL
ncbi:MAG: glycosyltransferase family 39 protein [Thermodesulfobacteriota bacterium]|nr:glycosyltransferase family 39 protein [Thermodesulfobacteriota bacterium]